LQTNIQIHYFNVSRSTFGTSFLIWTSAEFTSFMTGLTFTLVAITSWRTRTYTCPKTLYSHYFRLSRTLIVYLLIHSHRFTSNTFSGTFPKTTLIITLIITTFLGFLFKIQVVFTVLSDFRIFSI